MHSCRAVFLQVIHTIHRFIHRGYCEKTGILPGLLIGAYLFQQVLPFSRCEKPWAAKPWFPNFCSLSADCGFLPTGKSEVLFWSTSEPESRPEPFRHGTSGAKSSSLPVHSRKPWAVLPSAGFCFPSAASGAGAMPGRYPDQFCPESHMDY